MENVKERHGCLTAWLILMIVANAFTAISTPMMTSMIRQTIPSFPEWVVWPIALMGLLNIVFAVALFQWKRWGFYGFCAAALIALLLNMYAGLGVFQSLLGLVGVALLYGVLQIGGEKSGWKQLE